VSPRADWDVVTVGETMVAFTGRGDGREYLAVTAGAESNVAAGLATLGLRTRWVSRLGDDHLGRFVVGAIAARGVDVAVVHDVDRATGVMTKHVDHGTTARHYYRSESAARELSPSDLQRIGRTDWIHVTGVTCAISPSAAALVDAALDGRTALGSRVSFDVNLRPTLWTSSSEAADHLLRAARRADLVLIGDDEAATLFDITDERSLADLILVRDDQELVLKRGPDPATLLTTAGVLTEPALPTDVVDATGAGDAFAAGYLGARCLGWPPPARLRLGHFLASRVVSTIEDVCPPLTDPEREELSPEFLATRWAAVTRHSGDGWGRS
jgi:2-dehydro-3-deoxygluconokinase